MVESPLTVTEQFLLISFDESIGDFSGKYFTRGFTTALLMDLELDGQVQVVGPDVIILPSAPHPQNSLLLKAYHLITHSTQNVKQIFTTIKAEKAGLMLLAYELLVDTHKLQRSETDAQRYTLLQRPLRTSLLQSLRAAILSGNITDPSIRYLAILIFTNAMLQQVIPDKNEQKQVQGYLKKLVVTYLPITKNW